MKSTLIIACYFLYGFSANAHINDTISIGSLLSNDSVATKHKVKALISFDSRHSLVANRVTKMGGLKLGLEFRDRWRFGFGFYGMVDPIYLEPYQNEFDIYDVSLNLGYVTLFGEYIIYKDFRWEVSLPFSIGGGSPNLLIIGRETDYLLDTSFTKVNIYGTNISAQYKIIPWFGIGGGFGFRLIGSDNPDLKKAFNSPILIFKIKFFLGDCYRCIFKPEIIKTRREIYNRQRRERKELGEEKKNLNDRSAG